MIRLIELRQISDFLDETLRVKEIEDNSFNGLQVNCTNKISRIGFAVDASMETFQRAKEAMCDLIVVHHGLFWKEESPLMSGPMYERIKFLLQNNIAVYAVHLPLDKHEAYGNNAQLAKMFGLNDLKDFGFYHGNAIGFQGELEQEKELEQFIQEIKEKLGSKITALPFGKKQIKKVGIVSGGASFAVAEAIEKKLDVLLTGETKHSAYHMAKDGNINVIFAGHYATETLGLKALAALLKQKFDIEVGFIDIPTGL
ncbi:Nif3-like dinuclear metal center hexameric protein [Candidatus Woesearchaeota archaeon]|nr:Nif3-like dinuclear metal center hexameric protein [Candidatus Woesearchaeota archaeon]